MTVYGLQKTHLLNSLHLDGRVGRLRHCDNVVEESRIVGPVVLIRRRWSLVTPQKKFIKDAPFFSIFNVIQTFFFYKVRPFTGLYSLSSGRDVAPLGQQVLSLVFSDRDYLKMFRSFLNYFFIEQTILLSAM